MMTEYKDNESYERDKAALIRIAEGHSMITLIDNVDAIANLLKQSKWVGNDESVRPIPVVRDKYGRLIKDYDFRDWLIELNEEYREATQQILIEDKLLAAEGLQDLITVCTSMQEWLGFDETARNDLAKQINEKNRRRGYLSIDDN